MGTADKLELSRADVDAVMDYIYQHVRASPNGRGYTVWEKMLAFTSVEEIKEENERLHDTQRGLSGSFENAAGGVGALLRD